MLFWSSVLSLSGELKLTEKSDVFLAEGQTDFTNQLGPAACKKKSRCALFFLKKKKKKKYFFVF